MFLVRENEDKQQQKEAIFALLNQIYSVYFCLF